MVGWYFYVKVKKEELFIKHAYTNNPVQDIQKLAECVKGDRTCCKKWLDILLSSILVYPIEKKYSPNLSLEAFDQKRHWKIENGKFLCQWHYSIWEGSLLKYQKNIMKKYQQLRVEENSILFYSGKDICRYHVNAITFLDHETMYFTFDSERIVAIRSLTFNSVGVEANFSIVKTDDESLLKIFEIKIMNKQ